MALTYEIDLKTGVGAELARAYLLATGHFTRYEDALNGKGTHVTMWQLDPDDPAAVRHQDHVEESFGFRPDLSVAISLNAFERRDEAEHTAVEILSLLAREIGDVSRATFLSDHVVFVQYDDVIVLDETWAAQNSGLVPLVGPVADVKDLRGTEAARGIG